MNVNRLKRSYTRVCSTIRRPKIDGWYQTNKGSVWYNTSDFYWSTEGVKWWGEVKNVSSIRFKISSPKFKL